VHFVPRFWCGIHLFLEHQCWPISVSSQHAPFLKEIVSASSARFPVDKSLLARIQAPNWAITKFVVIYFLIALIARFRMSAIRQE